MIYDYEENVKKDLKDYIKSKFDNKTILESKTNDNARDKIYDSCWTADSVTGNGSGSYVFSTFEAEENLTHNSNLIAEALEFYGMSISDYITSEYFYGTESLDVLIRCYLLDQCFNEILEEIQNSLVKK